MIQRNIIRYGFPILLTLGNVDNLMAIIIFYQKRHQQSSCSLYLIASDVFVLISVNWRLGSNLNALDHSPGPFTISLALSRTMIVLACIDRFISSSSRANISKN